MVSPNTVHSALEKYVYESHQGVQRKSVTKIVINFNNNLNGVNSSSYLSNMINISAQSTEIPPKYWISNIREYIFLVLVDILETKIK